MSNTIVFCFRIVFNEINCSSYMLIYVVVLVSYIFILAVSMCQSKCFVDFKHGCLTFFIDNRDEVIVKV